MVLKMKMSLRHILVGYTYPQQYLGCQEALCSWCFFELAYFCMKEGGNGVFASLFFITVI